MKAILKMCLPCSWQGIVCSVRREFYYNNYAVRSSYRLVWTPGFWISPSVWLRFRARDTHINFWVFSTFRISQPTSCCFPIASHIANRMRKAKLISFTRFFLFFSSASWLVKSGGHRCPYPSWREVTSLKATSHRNSRGGGGNIQESREFDLSSSPKMD